MKKNRMMRLASVLLVLCLLTTSVISGTFAKYVTTNSGADFARVAKFGVVITVADDMALFKTEYAKSDSNYEGTLSVESNTTVGDNSDNRVAPGTEGFMTFNISGTPEVATRLTVDTTGSSAITLGANTYNLEMGEFANAATSVTTTAVYEPIKFYFGEGTTVPNNATYDKTLADLETALEALSDDFAPNATLNKDYVIGWKWALENEFTSGEFAVEPYDGAKIVNFLDTYLGKAASATETETLNLKITVEQID